MSRNVTIVADAMYSEATDLNAFDALVIPGGLNGATTIGDNACFISKLKKFQATEGKIVAAMCAAPALVLAKNGLLSGAATWFVAISLLFTECN